MAFEKRTLNALARDPAFAALGLLDEFRREPFSFVDVGARSGVHEMVEPVAEITAVLGFEPDAAECARLMADPSETGRWASFQLEALALSDAEGVRTLHHASVPTNDSLLPPHEPFVSRYRMKKFEPVGTSQVAVTTLDKVVFERLAASRELGTFIKLDTQGSEWEILSGASRTLTERCVAVYAEVWFCNAYANTKLFSEVELLLRQHGFSFYGIHVWRGRSGRRIDKARSIGRERPFCVDAVFFKDPLPGGPAHRELSAHQWRCLFLSALLLGYADLALEIGETIWRRDEARLRTCRRLIESYVAIDPAAIAGDVRALAERIGAAPDRAAIEAGRYCDQWRSYWDFDDAVLPQRD
jgi:FkbM family methyltransferase